MTGKNIHILCVLYYFIYFSIYIRSGYKTANHKTATVTKWRNHKTATVTKFGRFILYIFLPFFNSCRFVTVAVLLFRRFVIRRFVSTPYILIFQVREQFDAFVAEHPNGKMKKKDFREMMQKEIDSKLKIFKQLGYESCFTNC